MYTHTNAAYACKHTSKIDGNFIKEQSLELILYVKSRIIFCMFESGTILCNFCSHTKHNCKLSRQNQPREHLFYCGYIIKLTCFYLYRVVTRA